MVREKSLDQAELARIRKDAAEALAALDQFESIVETFIQANDQRLDHFGLLAAKRTDLIYQMRRGKDFRRSTMRRVLAYMQADGGTL